MAICRAEITIKHLHLRDIQTMVNSQDFLTIMVREIDMMSHIEDTWINLANTKGSRRLLHTTVVLKMDNQVITEAILRE
jgi:hypothetical protein